MRRMWSSLNSRSGTARSAIHSSCASWSAYCLIARGQRSPIRQSGKGCDTRLATGAPARSGPRPGARVRPRAASAADLRCSEDAAEQAKRLLIFHMGEGFEDRLGFEPPRQAPSLRNPANPKQKFDVLEVVGYAAPHGEYRMRLIYYSLPRGYILIGQEILEHSSL
jgi:hypothetical protein